MIIYIIKNQFKNIREKIEKILQRKNKYLEELKDKDNFKIKIESHIESKKFNIESAKIRINSFEIKKKEKSLYSRTKKYLKEKNETSYIR